jgi:hypothetical protein
MLSIGEILSALSMKVTLSPVARSHGCVIASAILEKGQLYYNNCINWVTPYTPASSIATTLTQKARS